MCTLFPCKTLLSFDMTLNVPGVRCSVFGGGGELRYKSSSRHTAFRRWRLPDVDAVVHRTVHGIAWLDVERRVELGQVGQRSIASPFVWSVRIQGHQLQGALFFH